MDFAVRLGRWLVSAPRLEARDAPLVRQRQLAFEELHRQHVEFVFRMIQRLGAEEADAEDLTQKVFDIVRRRLDTFETGRSVKPWLIGICINVVRKHRARSRKQLVVVTGEVSEQSSEDHEANAEELAMREQTRALVRALLDELDPKKRLVLVMYEIDSKSYAEIASELAIPVGSVSSRLSEARSDFKRALARREARLRGKGQI